MRCLNEPEPKWKVVLKHAGRSCLISIATLGTGQCAVISRFDYKNARVCKGGVTFPELSG
jgi:hypothetical protein